MVNGNRRDTLAFRVEIALGVTVSAGRTTTIEVSQRVSAMTGGGRRSMAVVGD
jgi:hypothetical protein